MIKIALRLGMGIFALGLACAQQTWTPGGDDAPWPVHPRLKKLPTPEEWANMGPSGKAYVDKAKAIAGNDVDLKFEVGNVCAADGGSNKRKTYGLPDDPRLKGYPGPGPDPAAPMKPYKMFDNLWYFGTTDVGTYLLTTRDGYILFDALNNMHEARDIIIGGMKSVGLDPTKIKYFIIGHNHLDHTGGAHYIQSTFHPKTIMGRDDWRVYFDTMARAAKARAAGDTSGQGGRLDDLAVMTHDTDAYDSMKVTLGGTTVNIYMLPGHTPGALAYIFPVEQGGKSHNVLIMAAANDIDSRSSFTGYEHVWQMGLNANVESVLHVHPNILMNTLANMRYIDDHAKEPPLFLYGASKTSKYIEIERACTQARMEVLGW